MATVTFHEATRYYPGAARPAVDQLDLEVADGEFLVLVGPSGCGKSTTLRMLAGLEGIDAGTVSIGGRDVTDLPPKDRDIAMVFQNYALYPHLTVRDNIAFHLKIMRVPKHEIGARVAEAARMLDLTAYLDRRPAQLSGGQRQRVAMGRAIVRRPKAFLMDEPLSNLDAKLRVQTRTQIASLQRELAVTTVYVTHDQVEAMTMGDRVAVLDGGVLQQCDTPARLYTRPANIFVAGFIGSPAMNLLPGSLRGDGAGRSMGGDRSTTGDWATSRDSAGSGVDEEYSVDLDGVRVPVSRDARAVLTGDSVVVGVRPEAFDIVAPDDGMAVTVEMVENIGSDSYLYCSAHRSPLAVAESDEQEEAPHPLTVRVTGMSRLSRGDRIGLRPRPDAVHLFDASTGRRLPD